MIIAYCWAKIVLFLLKNVCGVLIKISDQNQINKNGVIFAVRHESMLDTILFLAYNLDIKYIVKKELLYVPFYGLLCGEVDILLLIERVNLNFIKNGKQSQRIC